MRFVAWIFLALAGCGGILGSSDDGVELPPRAEGDADASLAAEASTTEAGTETCTRRLPCGGTEVLEPGDVPPLSRLCLEACVWFAYDPNAFGGAAEDLVKIVDVQLNENAERVGEFNIGLARRPYVFAGDGLGAFNVLEWNAPRERWIHLRLDVRYASSPNAELFLDGELAAEGSIPALVRPPAKAVLTRGPAKLGVSPEVDLRFSLVRMTRY
jgi:hypothetical protein